MEKAGLKVHFFYLREPRTRGGRAAKVSRNSSFDEVFQPPVWSIHPLKKEQQHPKEENKIDPRELCGTDFAPDFGF